MSLKLTGSADVFFLAVVTTGMRGLKVSLIFISDEPPVKRHIINLTLISFPIPYFKANHYFFVRTTSSLWLLRLFQLRITLNKLSEYRFGGKKTKMQLNKSVTRSVNESSESFSRKNSNDSSHSKHLNSSRDGINFY